MTISFETLREASTPAEARAALGEFLGLDAPVPAGVLGHAFADQYYRHNLILSRNRPELLQRLLKHPRNVEFEAAAEDEAAEAAAAGGREESTARLGAKAGLALYAWAKSGFAMLDQEAFEARFAACEGCDQLRAPPEKWIYKLTASKRGDPRVCGACGCVAARKARLASESCPLADPADPALTRWGEPVRPKAPAGQ
ncbi:MAG: hypothetical protein ABWX67_15685 [Allosphingosinicella sp.]